MQVFDLRSDTLSPQSAQMRLAAQALRVGDDVFGEDPSTRELEAEAAALFGKEAGLLLPSGTMANLVSVLTHAPRGSEVVLGALSHIFNYERGGACTLGGVIFHTVDDSDGVPAPEAVTAAVRDPDLFHARTSLVCLENTHNTAGGLAVPLEALTRTAEAARGQGLPVHLDGARIFNACARLGVAPSAFGAQADSLMFCLSKGLCAPMGAVLVGRHAFIEQARLWRKTLGGGMRQTGYIASMGLYGLREWQARAVEDNDSAERFVREMGGLDGFQARGDERRTNVVYFRIDGVGDARALVPMLEEAGVRLLANAMGFRAVFHQGVSGNAVSQVTEKILACIKAARGSGSPR